MKYPPFSKVGKTINQLASPLALLTFHFYLMRMFSRYTWNHAFTHLLLITAMILGLLLLTQKSPLSKPANYSIRWLELIITGVLILALSTSLFLSFPSLAQVPIVVDIGQTTQKAAKEFFVHGHNPYQEIISKILPDAKFYGYKKGPLMFIVYGLTIFSPNLLYRLTTLFLLAVIVLIVYLLNHERRAPPLQTITTTSFFVAALLLTPALWPELMKTGSNDLVPLLFILVSLLGVKKKWWWLAGLGAGLSFSAKFAPAIFLIILTWRRRLPRRYYWGLLVGIIPFLFFLAWDYQAIINSSIIFHLVKPGDSTGLASITAPTLRYIYPTIQLLTLFTMFLRNLHKRLKWKQLTLQFTFFFLIAEATYGEIHNNHLVLFVPLVVLCYSWYRYNLLPNLIFLINRAIFPKSEQP